MDIGKRMMEKWGWAKAGRRFSRWGLFCEKGWRFSTCQEVEGFLFCWKRCFAEVLCTLRGKALAKTTRAWPAAWCYLLWSLSNVASSGLWITISQILFVSKRERHCVFFMFRLFWLQGAEERFRKHHTGTHWELGAQMAEIVEVTRRYLSVLRCRWRAHPCQRGLQRKDRSLSCFFCEHTSFYMFFGVKSVNFPEFFSFLALCALCFYIRFWFLWIPWFLQAASLAAASLLSVSAPVFPGKVMEGMLNDPRKKKGDSLI